MYENCHQKFKILFCEGNGSQTYSARGEDQYKSDLKSYWYLLKQKRQVSVCCSIPQSIWLEKRVQGMVLVDVDPV